MRRSPTTDRKREADDGCDEAAGAPQAKAHKAGEDGDVSPELAMRGKRVLVFDSREPGEPSQYLVVVDSAPVLLRERLYHNMKDGKCSYKRVYFSDGVEGMDVLLKEGDVEGDDDEQLVEEVQLWVDNVVCLPANEFEAPLEGKIDFVVSLADIS